MKEYVCVYATGTMVRDIAKSLLERNLVIRADLMEVFPMYLKNDKAKIGSNNNAVMFLVERVRLDEMVSTMESMNQWREPLSAYAFPVLMTKGIPG